MLCVTCLDFYLCLVFYVCFVVVCWYFVWFVALVLFVCGVVLVVVGFIVLLVGFVGFGYLVWFLGFDVCCCFMIGLWVVGLRVW